MKIYGDYLQRDNVVEDIVNITKASSKMNNPVSFSIEGIWGSGKTWIVDRVIDSLHGFDLSKNNKKSFLLKDNDYLVFKYNAWEKDYYDEPILAILITLINQLNKKLLLKNTLTSELKIVLQESKDVLESSLSSISKRVIGVDVIDVGKRGHSLFKKIQSNARIKTSATYSENIETDIKLVVKTLNNLSKEIPIVFIVDELDRCTPTQSIKTLERLHHVFGKVNHSVTIISVNVNQLKYAVEQMFGTKITFEDYLRKFVDFRLSLSSGDSYFHELHTKLAPFLSLFYQEGDDDIYENVLTNISKYMTPREFEKVCQNAMICHKLVQNSSACLSKNCATAEILLFACKIAKEKEDIGVAIYPNNGNIPVTKLGKFIKEYLRKIKSNSVLDLTTAQGLILFICVEVLGFANHMNITYIHKDNATLDETKSFYQEYTKYYRLIK